MIVLEELDSRFISPDDFIIDLKGINLSIEYGQCIGIISRTNSEKTALLRAISCLDKPLSGSIKIDNFEIDNLNFTDINQLKQNISFIDRDKTLLDSKSIYENIALPLVLQNINRDAIDKQIAIVSNFLGISDKLPLKPQQLSNFSKTLVCIARSLVTGPKLLICDDITHNLDLKHSIALAKKLSAIKIKNNIAIIVSSNDLEFIKNICDTVSILDKSSIIEQKPITDFIAAPASYIGREFIKAKAKAELPNSIKQILEGAPNEEANEISAIVRCCFNTDKTAEYFINEIIEKLNLRINILSGHQENINNTKLNIMLFEISGYKDRIDEAITLLSQKELYTEALGYVK